MSSAIQHCHVRCVSGWCVLPTESSSRPPRPLGTPSWPAGAGETSQRADGREEEGTSPAPFSPHPVCPVSISPCPVFTPTPFPIPPAPFSPHAVCPVRIALSPPSALLPHPPVSDKPSGKMEANVCYQYSKLLRRSGRWFPDCVSTTGTAGEIYWQPRRVDKPTTDRQWMVVFFVGKTARERIHREQTASKRRKRRSGNVASRQHITGWCWSHKILVDVYIGWCMFGVCIGWCVYCLECILVGVCLECVLVCVLWGEWGIPGLFQGKAICHGPTETWTRITIARRQRGLSHVTQAAGHMTAMSWPATPSGSRERWARCVRVRCVRSVCVRARFVRARCIRARCIRALLELYLNETIVTSLWVVLRRIYYFSSRKYHFMSFI